MSTLASSPERPPPRGVADRLARIAASASFTDWMLAAGAAFIALAFSVAALQALALRPAILPAFLVAGVLFPVVLLNPRWVVPIFFAVVWTAIGQSFFGGFSPPQMGSVLLLPLAAWYARSRRELARDAFTVLLLLGVPLLATGMLSVSLHAVPVDPFKDLAFLIIAALCIRTTKDTDRTAIALVLTGIFLAAGAVYSVRVHPTALFPLNEKAIDASGHRYTGPPRAAGPFGEANFFSLSLAAIVPFCMYLIAHGGRRLVLGWVGLIALVAGDFAAQSRGGAIAIAFAVLVMSFFTKSRRIRGAAWALVAIGAVFVVIFAAQVNGATSRDAVGRATENEIALHMFLDHPIVGVGPGQYGGYYRDYSRQYGNDPRYDRAPHSLPLQIAAEQGIVGIIGWLGAAIVLLRFALATGVWRDLLGRAVCVAVMTYCVGSLFLHGSQLRILWILVGLLLAHGAAVAAANRRDAAAAAP